MFKWISKLGIMSCTLCSLRALHLVPKRSSQPGLPATLKDLPMHDEVAINTVDNVIYRNVDGVIIKYVRSQDEN